MGLGRLLVARHSQLALPVSPAGSHSKCSTPAELEAEEMVSQLSDQVCTVQVYRDGYGCMYVVYRLVW